MQYNFITLHLINMNGRKRDLSKNQIRAITNHFAGQFQSLTRLKAL